jgi:hypothetical protein
MIGRELRRLRRRLRLLRQLDLDSLRGAAWAAGALRRVRRDVRASGLRARVEQPAGIGPGGLKGVLLLARAARATCLERSLILQAWHLSQGRAYEILVGVEMAGSGVEAHAWLGGWERARPELSVIAVVPTSGAPRGEVAAFDRGQ